MTPRELLEACDQALASGVGLLLVGPALPGYRPELLCSGSQGEVRRYSVRQVARLRDEIREALAAAEARP